MRKLILFAVIALVAACSSSGTSLSGSIPCGSTSCGDGQLCKTQSAGGIDASTGPRGPFLSCAVVPSGCDVYDCAGEQCSPCVLDLCNCAECTRLDGRQLSCGAQ